MSLARSQSALACFLLFLAVTPIAVSAHGPDSHGETGEVSEAAQQTDAIVQDRQPDLASGESGAPSAERPLEPRSGLMHVLRALHPATVHFPIAFFLLAGVLEAFGAVRQKDRYRQTVDVLIVAGAIGAVVAAVFGWVHTGLWLGGDSSMQLHRWTGTAVALAGIGLFLLLRRPNRRALRFVLGIVCLALVLQGFWGGELAHGPGHLV